MQRCFESDGVSKGTPAALIEPWSAPAGLISSSHFTTARKSDRVCSLASRNEPGSVRMISRKIPSALTIRSSGRPHARLLLNLDTVLGVRPPLSLWR